MPFFKSLPEDAGPRDVFIAYPEIFGLWAKMGEALINGPSPLSTGEREMIQAYVAGLLDCTYSLIAHSTAAQTWDMEAGLTEKLLDDPQSAPIDEKFKPLLAYVKKLTLAPSTMSQEDADAVFAAGWDEAALHFSVAICARFNLINRLVMGHGVEHTEALTAVWRDDQKLSYVILDEPQ